MAKPDPILRAFGFSVKKQRAARGLSQETLAEKADLDPTYLSDIERGTRNLSVKNVVRIAKALGVNSVDVIVGGPPCQGFSTVRQVDSANHGSRVRKDKRRYLYRIYLEYVAAFRPRAFVMENVLGIQSAAKGGFLRNC